MFLGARAMRLLKVALKIAIYPPMALLVIYTPQIISNNPRFFVWYDQLMLRPYLRKAEEMEALKTEELRSEPDDRMIESFNQFLSKYERLKASIFGTKTFDETFPSDEEIEKHGKNVILLDIESN
ncbi:unnamed protein product [Blepharisma stoltei]|uniref:Uncharacterized protein n=1 Tax=Blepharisma stoltei TaxID=1481888 RepID=A0AAU9IGL7_9CILI|nr:unnamed protein product [Blepharisma stoltei]